MSRALLALLLLGVVAAVASGGWAASSLMSRDDRARGSPDPAARSAATINLMPTPASVIERCRRVQAKARFPMLCPRILPRALIGWPPGQPPPPLGGGLIRMSPKGPDGVDIGYGAPWEADPGGGTPAAQVRSHLWRNRPCCFLHYVIQRGPPAPEARPAVLGGRRGRLLPASSTSYYGPYFGNHVRFFFRERGVAYVATLHTFGNRETTALLGRLIAELRPVAALRAPAPPRRRTTVPIGSVGPRAIAATPGTLWILTRDKSIYNYPSPHTRAALLRLDPASGRIQARIEVAGNARGLVATGGAVWVAAARPLSATRSEGVVIRVDPTTNRTGAIIRTGTWPTALAADGDGVWAVNAAPFFRRGTLVRIDGATEQLDGSPIRLGRAPSGIALGAGAVWVADALGGTVRRIDPKRRRVVATIRVGRQPYALAFAAGSLWATNSDGDTVSRIDPATNRVVATIRVGRNPYGIAAGARSLWAANVADGTVSRVDTISGRVVETIPVGGDPVAIAATAGGAWVAGNSEGTLTRIDER
jgi:YVTN family beta-propeller protein